MARDLPPPAIISEQKGSIITIQGDRSHPIFHIINNVFFPLGKGVED